MKITPLEIKRQEFKKSMRGYDSVEVDTFLEMLSNEFEAAVRRERELSDQVLELETQLREYRNIEKTLQETLRQAQETSTRSIDTSKREASVILQEAELKAAQVLDKARLDFAKMKEEISTLKARKEALTSRLRVLLTSEIELIRALEIEDDGIAARNGAPGDTLDMDDILKKL